MKRVAIFGNGGGGKSTLARRLAELTGLPLHPLDLIEYRVGGAPVPREEYLQRHAELLDQNAWIIEGYGCRKSAWERFAAADTLIHIDLPLSWHFLWVTKRFFKGLVKTPEGWPEGSPMVRSTIQAYKVLYLCNKHLTPAYRQLLVDEAPRKRVHHLRSPAQMATFLAAVEAEFRPSPGSPRSAR